jgi:SulP family sulfate permease
MLQSQTTYPERSKRATNGAECDHQLHSMILAMSDSTEPELDDRDTELNQPGLGRLREAVASYARGQAPGPPRLRRDGIAGLNTAISSVPDGMASGLLAGVNPVYGLYACILGPIAGGLVSSAQLMVITTTSAASLMAGQILSALPFGERDAILVLLVILVGALQISFGLLGMGRLTRFVSYSVMTGFLAGISVLLVLSQLPTVTGYQPVGQNRVTQTLDLLANYDHLHLPTLGLAVLTLLLAIVLPKIGFRTFGTLIAILVPSVLAFLFSLDVSLVRNIGEIGGDFPDFAVPSPFDITFEIVTGAVAIAAVTLIQGAGVSQSVPNPDGSRRRSSRDFIAQGAANIASGLFRGIPVGGSLGATAINVASGARTRWSVIFAGVWMLAIVVIFSSPVSYIAMPALAAILILAGIQAIRPSDIALIWRVGWPPRLVAGVTFIATLFLPLQAAVGFGAALSALIYIYRSSIDISLVEQIVRPDGGIEERKPAEQLASNEVTVLYVYGHLFYAGAAMLDRLLPRPNRAQNPVVVLRLRGQITLGATILDVLSRYAEQLRERNGRLYVTGVNAETYDQMVRDGRFRLIGPVRAYEVTPIIGESTRGAHADAQAWLVNQTGGEKERIPE